MTMHGTGVTLVFDIHPVIWLGGIFIPLLCLRSILHLQELEFDYTTIKLEFPNISLSVFLILF